MVILALETATRAGSVALAIDGTCVSTGGDATRPHGHRLPADVLGWLAAYGRDIRDVDLFAVASGPGSFTGLRVGLATVQGLALATGRPAIGVPTLEALAETNLVGPNDRPAVLVACLDGQRGEVFSAAWRVGNADVTIDRCDVLLEPAASRPSDLAAAIAAEAGSRAVTIVGDGGLRYADVFARVVPQAQIVAAPLPLADTTARLAARRAGQAAAPHALRPIYLRPPDASAPKARAAGDHTIRRLGSRDDLGAVEALQRQTFANPWSADSIRWELQHTDVARLYVMEDAGGTVVAYCACWMVFDELHINSLAVDASRRRRGLARRLLTHVLAEAADAGASAATLEVRTSNEAARRLYEGLGFVVEGVRRDYYQDPREDAIILWKRALQGHRGERRGPP
ncbi:MAG: tRNA (adenosine(37)-N6)-threonylcarbamoyltransferase complex dimerization subunit type 1 TsaB [Acidobacteria bacterium]|nr:tRNA (adenosine(37)-N6)-threonylcarbamoyltransferase complex dimerization subunit type 1 TsaB [Acidobacteriota bacterium]